MQAFCGTLRKCGFLEAMLWLRELHAALLILACIARAGSPAASPARL
jgi:hypothetical protein